MSLTVNIICRNPNEDRVIPRFSRYLRDHLGWSLTARPLKNADAYYLSGYFEESLLKPWPAAPVAAYFTHREEQPPGNEKAAQYDRMAARVDLRIATAAMYAGPLAPFGPTAQINPPVERDKFTIKPGPRRARPVVGLSGWTYANQRKGEDLARTVIGLVPGVEWKASGRGWPVPTNFYPWAEMERFYQSLDVLVIVARVEGVPMPPLEAMACGVSVVIPMGVGLLDELPNAPGIYRYQAGNARDCARALEDALADRSRVGVESLRAITKPYTVGAWCEQHRQAFEEVFACNAAFTA